MTMATDEGTVLSDERPSAFSGRGHHPASYPAHFSDDYARFSSVVREGRRTVSEHLIQMVWYDQLFSSDGLQTSEGKPLRIISPGWWNRAEGPDFKGAQVAFGDTVRTGEIEIHLDHGAWTRHGHHIDERYDGVILVVVLDTKPPKSLPMTSQGRAIPCLLLGRYVNAGVYDLPEVDDIEEAEFAPLSEHGYCAALAHSYGTQHIQRFIHLAGEWRLLNKARSLRERIERVGADQAVYESFMAACGYSRYKHHFRSLADQLPYERVIQLARQDPLLVETAFLQLAGLLPESLPGGDIAPPHFARLCALRVEHLAGLTKLPLSWKRVGVRPNNYPERRLSGAARFIVRTSREGLIETLRGIWREDITPLARRRAFEAFFPKPIGFWAEHCTWTGQRMRRPVAPLGAGRARSIIGNVFIPAALAIARRERDRALEERVYAFFAAMPKESDNRVVKWMVPRVLGDGKPPRLDFRTQQGLLQIFQDWCEPNPSCKNCAIIPHLELQAAPQTGAPQPRS